VNPISGWISGKVTATIQVMMISHHRNGYDILIGSCAEVRPCLYQLESKVTPEYRDALREYLYSGPSDQASLETLL